MKPSLYIAYYPSHVSEAASFAQKGFRVVSMEKRTEEILSAQKIPFISIQTIMQNEAEDDEKWWLLAHKLIRDWYRVPAMQFFAYEGIRLGEVPEPILETYIAQLFYYARLYRALKNAYPDAVCTIAAPDPARGMECLSSFQPWAPIDAARLVGLTHIAPRRPELEEYVFLRSNWKTLLLSIYNWLITLLPRRSFTIYTSEYWTHFAPLVPYLPDTEFIIAESRQFFSIPWRLLLKHRMRVFRSFDPISRKEERAVRTICREYELKWKEARTTVRAHLETLRDDLNWDPVLEALDYLILYAPQIVADIRTLRRVMERERPDIVLQMASVGGPKHYFLLMARVASLLHIPSVELQHAGATIDPRSVFSRIETDYLLTYGQNVNEAHSRIGAPRKKLIAVGSPRFDRYVRDYSNAVLKGKEVYAALGLDPERPVLVAIVPFSATYVSAVDSYQLADYYQTVRNMQKAVPGLQILFKVRDNTGVNVLAEYLKHIFASDYAISGASDIFPLLAAADTVLCNNSTVIYQAILAKKPLVLYPWKKFDSYHAQVYASAAPLFYEAEPAVKAVARTFTDSAYRNQLLTAQKHFLEGYLFDGMSSKRVAHLLKRIGSRGMPY